MAVMYTYDTYLSPNTWRYGTPDMRQIWSERYRRVLMRRVWIALATAQHEAGLVSAEQLAEIVHMGKTAFYENFKRVMHLSPLQYAKSVKLYEAQKLIKEGKNVSEAGRLVGYSSAAQFSREYKRHFGFVPSAT